MNPFASSHLAPKHWISLYSQLSLNSFEVFYDRYLVVIIRFIDMSVPLNFGNHFATFFVTRSVFHNEISTRKPRGAFSTVFVVIYSNKMCKSKFLQRFHLRFILSLNKGFNLILSSKNYVSVLKNRFLFICQFTIKQCTYLYVLIYIQIFIIIIITIVLW